MTGARAALGAKGEAAVARWLVRRGFSIEARNWGCRVGELDLVARKGELLVFVEVRTVSTRFMGRAIESITPAKQGRVARAAQAYLAQRQGAQPRDLRFDVAGVRFEGVLRRAVIDYVEHAFVPASAY